LSELPEWFDWVDGPADDPKSWEKAMKSPVAREALHGIISDYEYAPWVRDELHQRFNSLASRLDVSRSKLDAPIRVPVTGRTIGLPLFELFEYLGRDETVARLRAGRARLG
jgi:glutamyl-tRNA synthetase